MVLRVQPADVGELRILMRLGTARDEALALTLLEAEGLSVRACSDLAQVLAQWDEWGAGVLLVAEEALDDRALPLLRERLQQQPPWSDLPLVLLARPDARSMTVAGAMELWPNTSVIERPLRAPELVSVLRSALRARSRQYQIRALLEGLQRDDARKNEFIATLAHELRNPLAPMANALALLGAAADDAQTVRSSTAMMQRQLDHLVRLIDDLMEIARITRGKVQLQREWVDLNALLDDAVALARPAIDAAGHRLHIERAAGALPLWGDRVRLAQVFANLLGNAAKYTPRGGRVDVSVRGHDDHVSVAVTDNGDGLAADMLGAVFDMFVQAQPNARMAPGGLGIGLTLVRTLVQLHGGSVNATSPGLGRGSTFVVRLPLGAPAHASAPPRVSPTPAAPTPAIEGLRVLIVDDNVDAAESLAALLRHDGAAVTVAHEAMQALRAARVERFDAAVLDIGLPGMDGCELARRLRGLGGQLDEQATLVALTGWGHDSDRERIFAAGFDHHLLKPADATHLRELLAESLRKAA
jgi:signal transduction histidine kinase/ActR/RegA family two-component response regulator